jgi:hypothetical protein
VIDFPLPGTGQASVVVPAPAAGPGFWAGAPSAAFAADGTLVIAYRVRTPDQRGASLVVATSRDGGETLRTVATLDRDGFAAESLERPALVRLDPGWRMYVSCATPGSKHWRIDALDVDEPARFSQARPRTVFAGDERIGVKDPVVRRAGSGWQAWICCHPLDDRGEEDRMTTAYATSGDGIRWTWHGEVLAGRPGRWDARGARVTAVLPDGRASYDGRASKEENFSERTGVALPREGGGLSAVDDAPAADVRYLDLVPAPGGGHIALYERPRPDASHELCLERFQPA